MRRDEWGDLIAETPQDHLQLAQEVLPFTEGGGCRDYEITALRDAIEHIVEALKMVTPVVAHGHPHYNLQGDD